jgi:uncharacterized membrane protein
MKRSTDPRRFLSAEESARVGRAVAQAEGRTSAEVRLLIVRHCWGDLHRKAGRLFRRHGLDKTEQRNAVMVMLVTTNRQLLIYGDRGIHEQVGEGFWDSIRDQMVRRFKAGEVGEGLCDAIHQIGQRLAEFFPRREGDVNEIPDGVAHDE